MELLLNLGFIILARVTDVSLSTIRMLMLVRGRRITAAGLGFFEVTIYLLALGRVVQHLDDPLKIIAYGLGFSLGTILGGVIEERLAIGHTLVQVIPKNRCGELIRRLRAENFGVTVLEGQGRSGPRSILNITLRRKNLPQLLRCVDELDPIAFVTIFDARKTKGGFILGNKKK